MRVSAERVGIWGLLVTTLLICVAVSMRVYAGSLAVGPRDGFAQLLPWLLVLVALIVASFTGSRLRLALAAGAVVMLLRLALPMLVEYLPGTEHTRVLWSGDHSVDPEFQDSVASGAGVIGLSEWLLWVASVLVVIFVVVVAWGLRSLLVRRASTASFSIDLTVLQVVLYCVILFSLSDRLVGSFGTESVSELVTDSGLWLRVQVLSWLVPLALWLAFTLRQGGAIALGTATGLVVTLLLVPAAMKSLESWLDGPSGHWVYTDGALSDASIEGYDVLDIWGPFPWAGLVAAVMLAIVLWWALGTHAGGNPSRTLATTRSPVNSLSVVAFVLSWIPLTAIPGIVLGHMAYDQIVDGDTDQRGLGLSRWAIVLGYLSIVGALLVGYNAWAK